MKEIITDPTMEQVVAQLVALLAIVFVPIAKPIVSGIVRWLKSGLSLITKDETIHDFILPFCAILTGVGVFALIGSMYSLSFSEIIILGTLTGVYTSGMYKIENNKQ